MPADFFNSIQNKANKLTINNQNNKNLYQSKKDIEQPSSRRDYKKSITTDKKKKTYYEMHNQYKKNTNLAGNPRKFQKLNTCRSTNKKISILPEGIKNSIKRVNQKATTTRDKKSIDLFNNKKFTKRHENFMNMFDGRYGYDTQNSNKFNFKNGYENEAEKNDPIINLISDKNTISNSHSYKKVDSNHMQNPSEISNDNKSNEKTLNFDKLTNNSKSYINNYLKRTESNKTNTLNEKVNIMETNVQEKDLDETSTHKNSPQRCGSMMKPDSLSNFSDNQDEEQTKDLIELPQDTLPRKLSSPVKIPILAADGMQDVETELKEAQHLIDSLKEFFINSPFGEK